MLTTRSQVRRTGHRTIAPAKTPQITRLSNLKAMLAQKYNNKVFVDTTSVEGRGKFTHVDLFSGAGGNIEGLRQAGFETILSVEIDDDASDTLETNFPGIHHIRGDITKVNDDKIKKAIGRRTVDLLSAGFPCQGFSIAGFQNIDDARNILYRQVVRFVRHAKPKYVVLENVPGIISMNNGKFVHDIRSSFARLGYPDMSVLILESADYGVPQIRPRAVFMANRLGMKNPYPRPILKPQNYVSIESAIRDLEKAKRNKETNHEWTDHRPDMIRRISKISAGGSLYSTYIDCAKRQYLGVPSMTIKENHGGSHIHYKIDRMISAREMARLQSFPDSFKFCGTMKRAMWQIGNAAPPLLFKHIGKAVMSQLI